MTKEKISYLRAGYSKRKSLLFLCACVSQANVGKPLADRILGVAEASADGISVLEERNTLLSSLLEPGEGIWVAFADLLIPDGNANWPAIAVEEAARAVGFRAIPPQLRHQKYVEWQSVVDGELVRQTEFLRDIFGNPFRPVTISPSWRTDTVAALAAQMYESRSFEAMGILADALQDAGCPEGEILEHCRGPGPHVRGCWVVDLVLDKE